MSNLDVVTVTDDGSTSVNGIIPCHLGRYRIDGLLGSGGMGVVLAAHDPELDRAIAIKLLRCADEDAQDQLLAEAQAMARLRHANVVAVHDVGVSNGRVFIAMELVAGVTLREWLRTRRTWRAIVVAMIAAARGIAAAHSAGIIHRDFKLDNVLVGDDGSVRVADFGLSSEEFVSDARPAGTPAYMAPEQHVGTALTAATDQYSFAVAMWEALEGERPFAGEDTAELVAAKLAGPRAPRGSAPRWLFALLRRALAHAPEARLPSMLALIRSLERGLGRRRRVAIAALGLAMISGTAAAALALSDTESGPDCDLASTSVDDVWNDGARLRVTTMFGASARPHARATSERVIAALDEHATALGEARVAACNATYERGEQSQNALDRRMECLDRRVGEMAALVELFERAPDADVIDRAYRAVAALSGADSCTSTETARRIAPPILIRPQVDAAEDRRAEAAALRSAGKLREARTAFDAVVGDVRALGYAPLLADVEYGRACTLGELGNVAEGIPAFRAAAIAAATAGNDRIIAESWLGQLDLLNDAGGKPAEAMDRLSFAEVAVARVNDAEIREQLLLTKSDIELELDKFAEAKIDIEEAVRSVDARGATRTLVGISMRKQMVTILFRVGDYARALAMARETLEMQSALLGSDHLEIAKTLNNLAIAVDNAGDYNEALALHARALEIKERNLGPSDPSVAITLHNLGVTSSNLGRYEQAIAYDRRAIEIRERTLGPEHPLVASTLSNLSGSYRIIGRYDDARVGALRALEIREKASGPDNIGVAFPLLSLSTIALETGNARDALAYAKRALAIREKALGPRSNAAGLTWEQIGDAHERLGDHESACAAYARGVEILEASTGPTTPDLVGPLTGVAHCGLLQGRPAQSRTAAARVLAIVEAVGAGAYESAGARFVMANVLWATPSSRRAAIEEAKRALADFSAAPIDARMQVSSIESWLRSHRVRDSRSASAVAPRHDRSARRGSSR